MKKIVFLILLCLFWTWCSSSENTHQTNQIESDYQEDSPVWVWMTFQWKVWLSVWDYLVIPFDWSGVWVGFGF